MVDDLTKSDEKFRHIGDRFHCCFYGRGYPEGHDLAGSGTMEQAGRSFSAITFTPSYEVQGSARPETIDPFPSSRNSRLARSVIRARARRRQYFKASLFSDPAWDILLSLFVAECENRRMSVSAVGLTGNIPMTTALRWLAALEGEGLISREEDPLDKRRIYVSLTDQGLESMQAYFQLSGNCAEGVSEA